VLRLPAAVRPAGAHRMAMAAATSAERLIQGSERDAAFRPV
jgi:hypothetical protein